MLTSLNFVPGVPDSLAKGVLFSLVGGGPLDSKGNYPSPAAMPTWVERAADSSVHRRTVLFHDYARPHFFNRPQRDSYYDRRVSYYLSANTAKSNIEVQTEPLPAAPALSVAFRVRFENADWASKGQVLYRVRETNGVGMGFDCYGGVLRCFGTGESTGQIVASSSVAVDKDVWVNAGFVYQNDVVRFYLDGQFREQMSLAIGNVDANNTGVHMIGNTKNSHDTNSSTFKTTFFMAACVMWDRALTDDEMVVATDPWQQWRRPQTVWTPGPEPPPEPTGDPLWIPRALTTGTSRTTSNAIGKKRGGRKFDGNGYLQSSGGLTDPGNRNHHTWLLEFKETGRVISGQHRIIWACADSDKFAHRFGTTGNRYYFSLRDGNWNDYYVYGSRHAFDSGEWVRVALQYTNWSPHTRRLIDKGGWKYVNQPDIAVSGINNKTQYLGGYPYNTGWSENFKGVISQFLHIPSWPNIVWLHAWCCNAITSDQLVQFTRDDTGSPFETFEYQQNVDFSSPTQIVNRGAQGGTWSRVGPAGSVVYHEGPEGPGALPLPTEGEGPPPAGFNPGWATNSNTYLGFGGLIT